MALCRYLIRKRFITEFGNDIVTRLEGDCTDADADTLPPRKTRFVCTQLGRAAFLSGLRYVNVCMPQCVWLLFDALHFICCSPEESEEYGKAIAHCRRNGIVLNCDVHIVSVALCLPLRSQLTVSCCVCSCTFSCQCFLPFLLTNRVLVTATWAEARRFCVLGTCWASPRTRSITKILAAAGSLVL